MMQQYSVYFTLLAYAKYFFLTQKVANFQKPTAVGNVTEVLVKNDSTPPMFSSKYEISLLYTHFYFFSKRLEVSMIMLKRH